MELKPGYKQTEVGVIPEEWEVALVREVVATVQWRQRFRQPEDSRHAEARHPVIRIHGLELTSRGFIDIESTADRTSESERVLLQPATC